MDKFLMVNDMRYTYLNVDMSEAGGDRSGRSSVDEKRMLLGSGLAHRSSSMVSRADRLSGYSDYRDETTGGDEQPAAGSERPRGQPQHHAEPTGLLERAALAHALVERQPAAKRGALCVQAGAEHVHVASLGPWACSQRAAELRSRQLFGRRAPAPRRGPPALAQSALVVGRQARKKARGSGSALLCAAADSEAQVPAETRDDPRVEL
ncbi:hypothetical protein ON010_g14268 [Phytophthora cinnamomi]|nr:hypothetical protein ON010_g14268 [Phytophthora cinnamomi]